MEAKSFVLYTEYSEHIDLLTDEEAGKLIKAIFGYVRTGKVEQELNGAVKMAFSFIRKDIDRDQEKYRETCARRSDAGKKGGAPKGNTNAKNKQNNQLVVQTSKNKQKQAKQPDNDNEYDNDNDINLTVNNKILAQHDEKSSPCAGSFLLNDGTSYEVSEADLMTYQSLYQAIDVREELRKITAWCLSNPKNRKTKTGAKRFLNAWLSRAQNSAKVKDPKPAASKTRFNNFEQRQNNYAALERQLLS